MKKIGVTGNMGCGKSTVLSLLSKYDDLLILECDSISKEILKSHLYDEEIKKILGGDVFDIDGSISFKQVAGVIFSDKKVKDAFENLIHPLVWAFIDESISKNSNKKLCIIESAIIFEMNSHKKLNYIITVTCDAKEQMRRLIEERKLSIEYIAARQKVQIPSKYKEVMSDFVISTDCNYDELEIMVNELYESLKNI